MVNKKHHIKPSANFTDKTIARIVAINRKRKIITDSLFALLIFSPVLLREIWVTFFYHHNFFSASAFPFSRIFLVSYTFVVSSIAVYTLIGIGAIIVSMYFFGTRRLVYSVKYFTQIFSFNRYRS